MTKESTHILKKIFVKGFYRMHAGMFIFLFASVISSCFFVNTLGELPPGSYFFWHFIITITLVSNPVMMFLFFMISFFYAAKNLQYVRSELQKEQNNFLFYSINNLPKHKQFRLWLIIESYIFLPLAIYTLFSILVGVLIRNYYIPIAIAVFILLLVVFCSYSILVALNKPQDETKPLVNSIANGMRKPLFVLYTYYVVNNTKLIFLLTKFISVCVALIIFYNYPDLRTDSRMSCITLLLIVTAHTLLIYRERIFNNRYLSFFYNFPYSASKSYFGFTLNYVLLLLPEFIWLFTYFNFVHALLFLCFVLSIILLFRSIINLPGMSLYSFLKIVFVILCFLYILISYNLVVFITVFSFLLSYIISVKNSFYNPVV